MFEQQSPLLRDLEVGKPSYGLAHCKVAGLSGLSVPPRTALPCKSFVILDARFDPGQAGIRLPMLESFWETPF